MLSNFSTIFLKLNNITSNNRKSININTSLLLVPSFKKNLNNYIALSNQKSFEIYSKYNTNVFPRFSVLDVNKNKKIEETIWKKYINPSYFYIGCFYIFLASFSIKFNLQLV